MIRIAVTDDYLGVVKSIVDWSRLGPDVELRVFRDNLPTIEAAAAALAEFDVLCVMRERMPLPRALIDRLPNLKLIVTTGGRNRSIDLEAAKARGIVVSGTRSGDVNPTCDLAFGLIISCLRNLNREDRIMREGGWQERLGVALHGKTLGVIGLGNLGQAAARVGQAFGMNVIAWSQNLTAEKAQAAGVEYVSKEELFRRADVMTIHLILSERTRNLVGAAEFALMKPTAVLVNTSRGPIVNEAAMIETLRARRIKAAGLDVYDQEPLPKDHPLRTLDNVVLAPHLGYATDGNFKTYYEDTIEAIAGWRAGKPVRVIEA